MRISDWSSDVCSSDLRRLKAARVRAAREREERVAAALDKLAELEAERARRSETNKAQVAKTKEQRAATNDPPARLIKMAERGSRPLYSLHVRALDQGHTRVGNTDVSGSTHHAPVP